MVGLFENRDDFLHLFIGEGFRFAVFAVCRAVHHTRKHCRAANGAANFAHSADAAAEFVALAIQQTPHTEDTRFGVWFEPLLPRLCPAQEF